MSRTVAIVQARTGSSRLPGKVLRPLAGKPMVQRVVERASRIAGLDALIVATSDRRADDELAELVASLPGIGLFRGSETDVLARYYHAAVAAEAEIVVRVTADCPLLSPLVSSRVVAGLGADGGGWDYAANNLERTYPRGLDTEALPFEVLAAAHREARDPADREHVTSFVWRRPDRFRLRSVTGAPDLSHLRWTVDTPQDLELAQRLFDELAKRGRVEDFELEDVLAALRRHPEWSDLNREVRQKGLYG